MINEKIRTRLQRWTDLEGPEKEALKKTLSELPAENSNPSRRLGIEVLSIGEALRIKEKNGSQSVCDPCPCLSPESDLNLHRLCMFDSPGGSLAPCLPKNRIDGRDVVFTRLRKWKND